jgi:molecular chaperone DnaK (HSP70)
MSDKILLGSQLKELLSGLADHGHQHLSEAERDLVQTTVLLGEAIEKLSASFMGIHEAVRRQQKAVEALLDKHSASSEAAGQLKAVQEEIGIHVNSAVTGLQFQDMTNQLIDRAIRRVGGIKNVLDTLGASGLGGLPNRDDGEISALLETISKSLLNQSIKLESALQKSVSQTHMQSGDVELF